MVRNTKYHLLLRYIGILVINSFYGKLMKNMTMIIGDRFRGTFM